jgi:hypothetical protein
LNPLSIAAFNALNDAAAAGAASGASPRFLI